MDTTEKSLETPRLSNFKSRGKAKTFYNVGTLEEYKSKNSAFDPIQENKPTVEKDFRQSFKFNEGRDSLQAKISQ